MFFYDNIDKVYVNKISYIVYLLSIYIKIIIYHVLQKYIYINNYMQYILHLIKYEHIPHLCLILNTPIQNLGANPHFTTGRVRYKDFAKATFADLMHHLSGTMWLNGLAKYWGETKDF